MKTKYKPEDCKLSCLTVGVASPPTDEHECSEVLWSLGKACKKCDVDCYRQSWDNHRVDEDNARRCGYVIRTDSRGRRRAVLDTGIPENVTCSTCGDDEARDYIHTNKGFICAHCYRISVPDSNAERR